jgi:triosephosphate isomerase (TIM)
LSVPNAFNHASGAASDRWRRPLVGGNWKMNTNKVSAAALVRGVVDALVGQQGVDVAVFPPFPYLLAVGAILRDRGSFIRLGAQDGYFESDGAFTGEVSLDMLKDCGVSVVLVGHSERRHVLGERETVINRKVQAVLNAGLECVLCIGETLDERQNGRTDAVNERQLRSALAGVNSEQTHRLSVAYEPVWAIGTGRTATPADAQDAHEKVRGVLVGIFGDGVAHAVRIQYGGSVKPSNASELFQQPDIDGGLIGGASLKPMEFAAIVKAAAEAGRLRQPG